MNLKKHIIKLAFLLLSIGLYYSCSTPKVVESSSVSKVQKSATSFSYYLPKTILNISVKIVHTKKYKGPFAGYSSRYLGINSGVITENDDNYSICNVSIVSSSQPDTSKKYYVYPISNKPQLINITSDGLLAGINLNKIVDNRVPFISSQYQQDNSFIFKELSIRPIVNITNKLTYEYKKIDSSLVRVPKEDKQKIIRNHKQLALEAAKFIATIRQNKFQLMAGISESDQLPINISQNISELKKVENSYLELFLGHVQKDTITYNIKYYPKELYDENPDILFYFSSKKGIVKAPSSIRIHNTSNGVPVNIIFSKPDIHSSYSINCSDGIAYCDPAISSVKILMRNKIFYNKETSIAQWGSIATLPKNILINDDYLVQFDLISGRLLNIKKSNYW